KGRSALDRYIDTRIALARAVWTENSPKKAAALLLELESELKGRHPLAESRYLRARIEEEAGRLRTALKILSSIDEKKISDSELRNRISWHHAWLLRKTGRLDEAASKMERLLEEEASTSAIARNRFWLAKT